MFECFFYRCFFVRAPNRHWICGSCFIDQRFGLTHITFSFSNLLENIRSDSGAHTFRIGCSSPPTPGDTLSVPASIGLAVHSHCAIATCWEKFATTTRVRYSEKLSICRPQRTKQQNKRLKELRLHCFCHFAVDRQAMGNRSLFYFSCDFSQCRNLQNPNNDHSVAHRSVPNLCCFHQIFVHDERNHLVLFFIGQRLADNIPFLARMTVLPFRFRHSLHRHPRPLKKLRQLSNEKTTLPRRPKPSRAANAAKSFLRIFTYHCTTIRVRRTSSNRRCTVSIRVAHQ